MYIEDACLERISTIENLQASLYKMEVVSCGNVTDKGIIALHKLRWVCYCAWEHHYGSVAVLYANELKICGY